MALSGLEGRKTRKEKTHFIPSSELSYSVQWSNMVHRAVRFSSPVSGFVSWEVLMAHHESNHSDSPLVAVQHQPSHSHSAATGIPRFSESTGHHPAFTKDLHWYLFSPTKWTPKKILAFMKRGKKWTCIQLGFAVSHSGGRAPWAVAEAPPGSFPGNYTQHLTFPIPKKWFLLMKSFLGRYWFSQLFACQI